MRRCLISVLAALLLVSGCARGSHYRVADGRVTFYLDLPDAQQVYFAYSLDGFRLHETNKQRAGTWTIAVPADIEFRYFFIVDGVVHLPDCKVREADDFGSENCIFEPAR
jgi:1,4-alpha-glucan branching enzyme